ncbi:TPA: hypothetical protein HA372_02255 [Candidatus Woesearchaeota archaeon]|nr:hypothetical protein [Candidatus Woesearchaeota archaeon]
MIHHDGRDPEADEVHRLVVFQDEIWGADDVNNHHLVELLSPNEQAAAGHVHDCPERQPPQHAVGITDFPVREENDTEEKDDDKDVNDELIVPTLQEQGGEKEEGQDADNEDGELAFPQEIHRSLMAAFTKP